MKHEERYNAVGCMAGMFEKREEFIKKWQFVGNLCEQITTMRKELIQRIKDETILRNGTIKFNTYAEYENGDVDEDELLIIKEFERFGLQANSYMLEELTIKNDPMTGGEVVAKMHRIDWHGFNEEVEDILWFFSIDDLTNIYTHILDFEQMELTIEKKAATE